MSLGQHILAGRLSLHGIQLALGWAANQDILLLELCIGILRDGHIQAHGCSHELYNVQDLYAGLGVVSPIHDVPAAEGTG